MQCRPGCRRGWVAGLWIAALGGGLAVSTGCQAGGAPQPPRPWPVTNSVLADDLPYTGRVAPGDTLVVARCSGSDTFWCKRRGDWEYTWMVARFDVLAVERGAWTEPTLSFITWVCWPTPESGTMVQMVCLYREGVTLAFELDTTGQPARVVGQELRHDPYQTPETRPAGP